jgi:Fe-Mn family superoxide dismutase
MEFTLPPLPYSKSALEPYISAEALEIHHAKHQGEYVRKLNSIPVVAKAPPRTSLEEFILAGTMQHAEKGPITVPEESYIASDLYNMAAQVWNHTFFWNSMSPNGGGPPTGQVADLINRSYGSAGAFAQEFFNIVMSTFGSGWVWLTLQPNGEAVTLIRGIDAGNPIPHEGFRPLLCIDVWEHAYYLDYHQRRLAYASAFMNHLVNWEFANRMLRMG